MTRRKPLTLGDRHRHHEGWFYSADRHAAGGFQPSGEYVRGRRFIGVPQMNFFHDAKLELDNDSYCVKVLGQRIELPGNRQKFLKENGVTDREVIVGIRPVHVNVGETGIKAMVDPVGDDGF